MKYLDTCVYNHVAVPVMVGALKVASPFRSKIKRGFRERHGIWDRLSEGLSSVTEGRKPVFWIHASSAGEFLQSVPLLEEIKSTWPKAVIICTYFSPSAESTVKSSNLVDIPSCLPIDSRKNAARIFSLLQPDILLFSRYDVWPNLVWEAGRRHCPAVLINATLSGQSVRLNRCWRRFYGRLYSDLELICTATDGDRENFLSIGVPAWKVEFTGDTKYDETYQRVSALMEETSSLDTFAAGRRVIIGGSTWWQDEKALFSSYSRLKKKLDDLYLIIVPHEPTPGRVEKIVEAAGSSGLHPETSSSLRNRNWLVEGDVMVVDRVGLLARLYGLSTVAVVGGGFSRGVHNVLEPAAVGVPILMGPNYRRSPETVALIHDGGALSVSSDTEMEEVLSDLLNDPERHRSMGAMALESVKKNMNATGRTLAVLRSTFPTLFPSPFPGSR